MQTEVTDINELSSLSSQLKTLSAQLDDSVDQLNSTIRQARDYDGIDVTTAGKTLRTNLKTIASDMKNVSRNITDYTSGIAVLDQDDFSSDANVFSLSNITENVGDFFTSTINNIIVDPVKDIANGIGEVGENIVDTITKPITQAFGYSSASTETADTSNTTQNIDNVSG